MDDSLDPETLTPLQLSKKLLEKHRGFMENYQREFDIRHKISVMGEKRDLLEHWISSAEDDGSTDYEHGKYLKEKDSVDSEILSLKKELQNIMLNDTNNESKTESKKRYTFLEEQMKLHKEAIDYWNDKVRELSRVTAKKETKKKVKAKKETKKKVKVKKEKSKAKKSKSKKRKERAKKK